MYGNVNCSRHEPGPKYFFLQGRIKPAPKIDLQWTSENWNPKSWRALRVLMFGAILNDATRESTAEATMMEEIPLLVPFMRVLYQYLSYYRTFRSDFKWLEHVGIQAWVYAPKWQTWKEEVLSSLSCYWKGFAVSLVRHELVQHTYLKEDQRSRGSQSKKWKL